MITKPYAICLTSTDFCSSVYKTPGLTPGRGQNIYNCKYTSPPPPGQVCDVNIKDFHKCTQENNYSYHKSSPCVFLKLNKIYGWIPAYYNDTNTLPGLMPKSLKEIITNQSTKDPIEVCVYTFWLPPCQNIFHFLLFFFLRTVEYNLGVV